MIVKFKCGVTILYRSISLHLLPPVADLMITAISNPDALK